MRVLLRLLSPLLALAVAAIGALLAIEVVAAWNTGGGGLLVDWPAWRSALEQHSWDSPAARWTTGGVAVVGLALVVIALGARRQDVELAGPTADVTVTTSPRVLARLLRQRIATGPELERTSVAATARAISVRARAGAAAPPASVVPLVHERVDEALAALRPVRQPRVSVRVDAPRVARPATTPATTPATATAPTQPPPPTPPSPSRPTPPSPSPRTLPTPTQPTPTVPTPTVPTPTVPTPSPRSRATQPAPTTQETP